MSAREAILGRLRSSALSGGQSDRKEVVAKRLGDAPLGLIPERGQLDHAGRTALFCEKTQAVQASVETVASVDDIPEAISGFLRSKNLPQAFRMGADERLTSLDWSKTPSMDIKSGPSDGHDEVGLSHAVVGVAETGTLLLTSGSDNPTTLNLLPETQIVVLDAKSIKGDFESALADVRSHYGPNEMPRTINMITGPSRSGDIEQTILLGAHGPRSLHVIVVDEE